MKISLLAIAVFAIAAAVALDSCKNSFTPGSGTPVVFPSSNVHYTTVEQLFYQDCITSGCHDDGAVNTDAKVSFTSWSSTRTSVSGMVIPGKPENSILIQYVEGKFYHYPALTSLLNQNQINGLKTWIAEGAPQN